MKVIPAIDLLDGRCVRLHQGDFNDCKVYPTSPIELAREYHEAGAEWLHVVDLAAARDGEGADSQPLFKLLFAARQKVQTGGGVRSGGDIEERLNRGASRVVVGSLCVTQTPRFINWIQRFGADRLVAALDVRIDDEGTPWPRIFGWTEGAGINLWDLLSQLSDAGLQHVLVTDISRDGAMHGPNLELYAHIHSRYPHLSLQASGGVSSLSDLRLLAGSGADAAISGKALLEGAFTIGLALEALA